MQPLRFYCWNWCNRYKVCLWCTSSYIASSPRIFLLTKMAFLSNFLGCPIPTFAQVKHLQFWPLSASVQDVPFFVNHNFYYCITGSKFQRIGNNPSAIEKWKHVIFLSIVKRSALLLKENVDIIVHKNRWSRYSSPWKHVSQAPGVANLAAPTLPATTCAVQQLI